MVFFSHPVEEGLLNQPESIVLFEEKLTMLIKTQAALEIAQFLIKSPTPEQIIAFHPSAEVAERAYELIYADRNGSLTEEERQ